MFTMTLRIGNNPPIKVASNNPRETLDEYQAKADETDEIVEVIEIIDESIVEDALYVEDKDDPYYWDNVFDRAEISGRDALATNNYHE